MSSAREALIEAVKSGDVPPDDIQVTNSNGQIVMTGNSLLRVKSISGSSYRIFAMTGQNKNRFL